MANISLASDVFVWGKMMAYLLGANLAGEETRIKTVIEKGTDPARIEEVLGGYPDGGATIMGPRGDEGDLEALRREHREAVLADAQKFVDEWQRRGGTSAASVPRKRKATGFKFLDELVQRPHGYENEASNNWVLHKNVTGTGAAILANDPHLSLQSPNIWMYVLYHCASLTNCCQAHSFESN